MKKNSFWTKVGTAAMALALAIFVFFTVRNCDKPNTASETPKIEPGVSVASGTIGWYENYQSWAFFEDGRAVLTLINPPREIKISKCKACQFEAEMVVRVSPTRIYPPNAEVLETTSLKKLICNKCESN